MPGPVFSVTLGNNQIPMYSNRYYDLANPLDSLYPFKKLKIICYRLLYFRVDGLSFTLLSVLFLQISILYPMKQKEDLVVILFKNCHNIFNWEYFKITYLKSSLMFEICKFYTRFKRFIRISPITYLQWFKTFQ